MKIAISGETEYPLKTMMQGQNGEITFVFDGVTVTEVYEHIKQGSFQDIQITDDSGNIEVYGEYDKTVSLLMDAEENVTLTLKQSSLQNRLSELQTEVSTLRKQVNEMQAQTYLSKESETNEPDEQGTVCQEETIG